MAMASKQLRFSSSGATRLKIVNPENLEKEIKEKASAFRTMAESTKKLKDIAVERMGGTIARAEIFEEQAEPIVGAIEKISKGDALKPKELAVGERVKAKLTEGAVLEKDKITPQTKFGDLVDIDKPPPPPSLLDIDTEADLPPVADPFGDLFKLARTLSPLDKDTTRISLKQEGGQTTINGRPVSLINANKTLVIGNRRFTLSPQVAYLLTGKFKPELKERIDAVLDTFDPSVWGTYRDILRQVGISPLDFRSLGNVPKATYIKQYLDAPENAPLKEQVGLGRKPPKAQSGRIQHDRFGDLKVDTKMLGQGIFSATDPSGNLAFYAKVSDGVRHLLTHKATKAQAGKGKFTEKDLETYHELASMAHVNHKPTDVRKVLKDPAVKSASFLPDDPKKLMDRLQTLMGLHGQGNDNRDVKTEALAIADRLLKSRHLTKGQHKTIFSSLL